MNKRKQSPSQKKRLKTMASATEEQKRRVVEELRKHPILQTACSRAGVGRSTAYKWQSEDPIFAEAFKAARKFGREFVTDMAESVIVHLIGERNLPATIFWLKNHGGYSDRVRHEYENYPPRVFTEKERISLVRAYTNIGLRAIIEEDEHILRQADEEQSEYNRRQSQDIGPTSEDFGKITKS